MDRDAPAVPGRPAGADRVPGISNAFLATGHSTLGITLAAVTGAHMAEFVHRDGAAPALVGPFRFPRLSTGPPRPAREGASTMARQLTIEDLLAARQPAEADISPDGGSIAGACRRGRYGQPGRSLAIRLWLGPAGVTCGRSPRRTAPTARRAGRRTAARWPSRLTATAAVACRLPGQAPVGPPARRPGRHHRGNRRPGPPTAVRCWRSLARWPTSAWTPRDR